MAKGICICGSEVDDNGRCTRQEIEAAKVLSAGSAVNYINLRVQRYSNTLAEMWAKAFEADQQAQVMQITRDVARKS